MRWEVSNHATAVLSAATSRICSKQHTASLCSSYLAFSLSILFVKVVQPYSSIGMATAWKNYCFILSER